MIWIVSIVRGAFYNLKKVNDERVIHCLYRYVLAAAQNQDS
jgi:hypothetical protein